YHRSARPVACCIHPPVTTLRPETRIKPGASLAAAREPSREKQKTEGRERAKTRLRTHPPLASQFPKPPPILGRTVKKKPTETGWSFKTWWWRRGEGRTALSL